MQFTRNDESRIALSEDEITLVDIINFLHDSWKKLIAASFIGMGLAFGGWLFLGNYSAEYVLLNNSNNSNNTNNTNNSNNSNNSNIAPLDLISLKTLQASLPSLAAQINDDGKVPEGAERIFKSMKSEEWWQKNLVPTYAISKADAKNLAGISKDLDLASTTILYITFTEKAASKNEAISQVRMATNFFLTGGAYLQLKSLLNSYENHIISTAAEIQQKKTGIQVEMEYQQLRVQNLEILLKRFSGSSGMSGQVVDPKDSGAKYLPLVTQIIAANNDINHSKETILRLQRRLVQLTLARIFLEQATPLANKTYDGLELVKQLLKVESDIRSTLTSEAISSQEFMDQLHAQLLAIQARFTKGLEPNTTPKAIKSGMLKTAMAGFLGTFFLMLLFLIGKKFWRDTNNHSLN